MDAHNKETFGGPFTLVCAITDSNDSFSTPISGWTCELQCATLVVSFFNLTFCVNYPVLLISSGDIGCAIGSFFRETNGFIYVYLHMLLLLFMQIGIAVLVYQLLVVCWYGTLLSPAVSADGEETSLSCADLNVSCFVSSVIFFYLIICFLFDF